MDDVSGDQPEVGPLSTDDRVRKAITQGMAWAVREYLGSRLAKPWRECLQESFGGLAADGLLSARGGSSGVGNLRKKLSGVRSPERGFDALLSVLKETLDLDDLPRSEDSLQELIAEHIGHGALPSDLAIENLAHAVRKIGSA